MAYPGSKAQAGTFQRIIGQMPPHSVYVEAFFGSGQIFWRKRPAAHSVIIDKRAGLLVKASAEPGVRAIPGDAISLLPELALPAGALVYCDPPYVLSTRKHRVYYDHEMTDADHVRLLAVLQGLKCNVMLSGYPSELYRPYLQDWRCCRYQARTRGRTVTECLWCNFPEPFELHDWRYAGKDFRERLGLKRLAARWLARLEGMPARKRGYVMNAVHQRYSQLCVPANRVMDSAAETFRDPNVKASAEDQRQISGS
jgi:DNA adenine methylase